jgi:membrane protein YqaA with SNARE-associated domain
MSLAVDQKPGATPPSPDAPAPPGDGVVRRLYNWVLHWAETPYGTPALGALSFAESSFFPIPPDVLQIALSVSKPKRSYFYAAVSAVASVLGGIAGWAIGAAMWSAVSGVFFSYVPGVTPDIFEHVRALYNENAFLAILTAAFTPIPYKVFTLASGVFGVPLSTLVVASVLGRSGRFFGVATAIYFFGPGVKRFLDKYLELATLVLLALGVAGFWVVHQFSR